MLDRCIECNSRGAREFDLELATAAPSHSEHRKLSKQVPMQVLVNHDNHVRVGAEVAARLARLIEDSLLHYGDRITRVEMHLTDENGHKGGPADQRCLLEARLANLEPIAVTHRAEEFQLAIQGALEKLQHALQHALGKSQTH